jgi:hypothetical protein
MKDAGTIIVTVTYKTQGELSNFRPHELCKRLRESLPILFDRGQIDPELTGRLPVPLVPPPASSGLRPDGWDDYLVNLSHDVQLQ